MTNPATMKALAERLYRNAGAEHIAGTPKTFRVRLLEEAATALDTAAAEIERLRGGVEVKTLDWKESSFSVDDRNATARSPVGLYEAYEFMSIGRIRRPVFGWRYGNTEAQAESFEAAKAACQADFTARIRSAIQGGENAE